MIYEMLVECPPFYYDDDDDDDDDDDNDIDRKLSVTKLITQRICHQMQHLYRAT
jgi:hypothetical protein